MTASVVADTVAQPADAVLYSATALGIAAAWTIVQIATLVVDVVLRRRLERRWDAAITPFLAEMRALMTRADGLAVRLGDEVTRARQRVDELDVARHQVTPTAAITVVRPTPRPRPYA